MPHRLETNRLILRPFLLDDVDGVYPVLEGHPDVWKYDPGYQRTREQRAVLVQKYVLTNTPDSCGTLAIELQGTHEFIGYVGLQLYVLPRYPLATPEVELFYKLGRDYWGQGYAFEACQELVRYAFEELYLIRLVSIVHPKNKRSLHLLEKLGMQLEPAPSAWAPDWMGTLLNPQS
jgi:[ribosomal protein S5]-alanine N-acetyltransferase